MAEAVSLRVLPFLTAFPENVAQDHTVMPVWHKVVRNLPHWGFIQVLWNQVAIFRLDFYLSERQKLREILRRFEVEFPTFLKK